MNLRDYDLLTRLLRTRPLVPAAVCFLGGCILAYAFAPETAMLLGVLAGLAAAALALSRRPRIAAALLALMMVPLGALRFTHAWSKTQQIPEQSGVQLRGRIIETPYWNPDTGRTVCVLDDIAIDGLPRDIRLRLYLRSSEDDLAALQAVQLGQIILCEARLWAGDPATNTGEFNFENYLRLQGFSGYATAKIEDAAFSDGAPRPGDRIERIRQALSDHIGRLFPRNADIVRAFLLGDRSGIDDETRLAYSNTGAAHLLAISGMHVSVLAMFLMRLLGRFMPRRYAFGATFALLLAYGALIGFSASLTRAIIMYFVFGLGAVIGRYSDGPTRLCAAMLVYLIIRPQAVLESGFVLSYGATAGLILLTSPLSLLFHIEALLHTNPGHGIKSWLRRGCSQLAQSFVATLAAQLAILPAVIKLFGAQPVWSVVVNLIAVPLAMAAYICSIIAAVTCLAPLAWVGDTLFEILNALVSYFGTLSFTGLRAAQFPLWLTLLCILACLLASDLCRLPAGLRKFLPLAVLLAFPVSNLCAQLTTRGASVVFLNAGQADCAVIRSEGQVYLVDTGDSYSPAAGYLSAMNYHPDGIFLSHLDSDHAGGLAGILEVCTPGTIYLSAHWANYAVSEEVLFALGTAQDRGCRFEWLESGDAFALSEKTFLKVLSPLAGFLPDSANDDSIVMHVSYGEADVLFTGDAAAAYLPVELPDVDLLKVAHHGGKRSVTAGMLAKLSPSMAVIPVGQNNYGHPADETLELLQSCGAQILRTDECGMIECKLYPDGRIAARPYLSMEDTDDLE